MNEEGALQKEAKMMRLEKLIAEREGIGDVEFPVPVEDVLKRYEQLYTGAVCDVLREFCLLDQALPGYLRPLRDSDVAAGIAFTVKSAPNVKITGEMAFRTQMLDEMGPNHFVVWDTSGDTRATLWGGVMTATAYGKGVRAACIDGGIRDTKQILQKPFPVYYKYRSPNGSLGRCLITHYQIPIRIGDTVIKPGDVILADCDGVLCVPRSIAYAVLVRAEEIRANEKRIFGWVASGESVHDITAKGGYF
jgi:4-hydroxy-4-methyl-2-oxoglutarate aldolase